MFKGTCGHCKTFTGSIDEIRLHQRKCGVDPRWAEVQVARLAGHDSTANRLARRILGVAEPMSEEDKEKLRVYNETHKEEIQRRRQIKATVRKNLKAKLKAGVRR